MDKVNLVQKAIDYLKNMDETFYSVAKNTGISDMSIGRYVKGTSRPTVANARIICQYFEKINETSNAKIISNINFILIPMIQIHEQENYLREFGDSNYIDKLPTYPVIADKDFNGKYRIFEVNGDSMDDGSKDSICDKDKILCREVKKETWGNLETVDCNFLIVLRDGFKIRQITKYDPANEEFICHSLNSVFNDLRIKLNNILELYLILKIIDRNVRK